MRTGRTFEAVHIVTKSGAFASEAAIPPNYYQHHPYSPAATTGWKSPVPYLFGGLAAMLGLIAFALLILACSYWKLSGNFDTGDNAGDDAGDSEKVKAAETKAAVYANSILVIMAGEEKPTFLAMPVAGSRTMSFGDNLVGPGRSCTCSSSSSNNRDELDDREDDKVVMTTVISDGGEEKR